MIYGRKYCYKVKISGTENLCISYYVNTKKNGRDVKETNYPLKEITKEQLLALRASETPGFVLKVEDQYYYTKIPKSTRLMTQNSFMHYCNEECKHCTAAPDCEGGCAKVRDLSLSHYLSDADDLETAIQDSCRIEKYSFIHRGFETFNTVQDCLVVAHCKNYERAIRQNLPIICVRKKKLNMAQLYK